MTKIVLKLTTTFVYRRYFFILFSFLHVEVRIEAQVVVRGGSGTQEVNLQHSAGWFPPKFLENTVDAGKYINDDIFTH